MFVQVNLMCSTARTKKVIVGLALIALSVACLFSSRNRHRLFLHHIARAAMDALFFTFSVVLPVSVLIINVLLVREVRRAANDAAANLGLQQHHQSTSSNSAVPTVMLVTTSLVFVVLRGTPFVTYLVYLWANSLSVNC